MKAIEFEGQNCMYMPPPEAKRGECGQLPVLKQNNICISVWKLEPGDLEALQSGAHVLLHVWGTGHPPVALTIQKMNELP